MRMHLIGKGPGRRIAFASCAALGTSLLASWADAAERTVVATAVRPVPSVTVSVASPANVRQTTSEATVPAAPADNPARGTVTVVVDHAKIIRLPERAQTVVVGNPTIADISVQKNGIVVVTGKSYGLTNLLALDGAGALLAESLISVQAATESLMVVQRGLERETYACTPNCQPSMQLGDAARYFGEVNAQAGQRNAAALQR